MKRKKNPIQVQLRARCSETFSDRLGLSHSEKASSNGVPLQLKHVPDQLIREYSKALFSFVLDSERVPPRAVIRLASPVFFQNFLSGIFSSLVEGKVQLLEATADCGDKVIIADLICWKKLHQ